MKRLLAPAALAGNVALFGYQGLEKAMGGQLSLTTGFMVWATATAVALTIMAHQERVA